MKTYSGSKDKLPVIPNLSTRWRCVINFTLRPFYPWEEIPVPLEQEAGWAQKLKWVVCKREKSLAPGLDSNRRWSTPQPTTIPPTLTQILNSIQQYIKRLIVNLIALKIQFTAVHCSFFYVCWTQYILTFSTTDSSYYGWVKFSHFPLIQNAFIFCGSLIVMKNESEPKIKTQLLTSSVHSNFRRK